MINKFDLQLLEDEQYELYKKLMEMNDEKLKIKQKIQKKEIDEYLFYN